MVTIHVHQQGQTRRVDQVDPIWLEAGAPVCVWVDITSPTEADRALLADTFHLHPLAIEDALSALQFPKIEVYDRYLYLVLHGVDAHAPGGRFGTRDIDFFLGPTWLLTMHDGQSRSIAHLCDLANQHEHVLGEGPVALLHRIVDTMVDNYAPEIDELERGITTLEEQAFEGQQDIVRPLLALKRDLAFLRRVVIPQRDVVGRLARREFPVISNEMAYRFRDVYDHLVRISDEAMIFQDRVTGILDAHLSAVSNRLNAVMKVLTVMSTIFLPLTVLTGMWGMNVPLPVFPGGEHAQFWWLLGMMAAVTVGMLAYFRGRGWV